MASVFEAERQELISALHTLRSGDSGGLEGYLLRLFGFQYKYNESYRNYCNNLSINPNNITDSLRIPPLPISAFKYHDVCTGYFNDEALFMSSGTTGQTRSKHHVRSLDLYLKNAHWLWNRYFPDPSSVCILALLPGYLERGDSSLVAMARHFISLSPYPQSGFFLYSHEELEEILRQNKAKEIPTILIGVTYALTDFAGKHRISFPELTIIETGGMKGRKEEITRDELHKMLASAFGVSQIYSEYGMTELLSQAYTRGGDLFYENDMLLVHTCEINDPLTREKDGKPGILTITDLCNIDSCAFIQTEDLGIRYYNSTFTVLGRLDNADIRGCNLMLQEVV